MLNIYLQSDTIEDVHIDDCPKLSVAMPEIEAFLKQHNLVALLNAPEDEPETTFVAIHYNLTSEFHIKD